MNIEGPSSGLVLVLESGSGKYVAAYRSTYREPMVVIWTDGRSKESTRQNEHHWLT